MAQQSLGKKLGLKPHQRALLLYAPDGFASRLAPLPEGTTVETSAKGTYVHVELFVTTERELAERAAAAIACTAEGGMLWIAYPKKSAKTGSDLSREVCWQVMTPLDWSPVAQIALDDTWSALRFRPASAVRGNTWRARPGADNTLGA